MNRILFVGLALAAVLAVNAGSAQAAESAPEKACTDQWDAMKAANKIPAGTTWPTFEKDCMAKAAAAPAAPAPAAKVASPATPATPVKAPAAKMAAPAAPTAPAVAPAPKMAVPAVAGVNGEQSRIKTCAGQWDQMKAANKIPAGLKWPEFWHDCDTKLKAAGQ
ncbi:MAG: hypothetical protein M3O03_09085 [Pseudomonadota bacterium]|nr:hypothetical protein [Pseudomonadota bacterium]